jgi:hypothetical protein
MAGTNADFYSLVQRRIWNDAGFRKLSRPAPNARDLFLYLLTTQHATQIPGLISLGESAMAEDLEWPLAGLRKALVELETAGMVKVDRVARLLWLPNGLRHNPPKSPDNVLGWAKHWRMLPECDLLREASEALMAVFVARGGAFPSAFSRVCGLPVPAPVLAPKQPPEDEPPPHPKGPPMVPPKADPPPRHQIQESESESEIPPPAGARAEVPIQGLATPEVLLVLVGRHPKLAVLHDDFAWANEAGAITAMKLVRATDAEAAVEKFVIKHAGRTWPNADDLRSAIGGYLANAKRYGDEKREDAARRAARPSNGYPRGPSRGPQPNRDAADDLDLDTGRQENP